MTKEPSTEEGNRVTPAKHKISSSEKKVRGLFERILKTEPFIRVVGEIRAELGIPSEGCIITEKDRADVSSRLHVPCQLMQHESNPMRTLRKLQTLMRPLTEVYPCDNVFYEKVLRAYIYYNEIIYPVYGGESVVWEPTGLCRFTDLSREYDEYRNSFHGSEYRQKSVEKIYGQIIAEWPLAVCFAPDASQRDVIDFIKANWGIIKETVKVNFPEWGKGLTFAKSKRNPEIERRNDFIYRNRERSTKEISRLLIEKKFCSDDGKNYLDDGHIRKIISLEKKRRHRE